MRIEHSLNKSAVNLSPELYDLLYKQILILNHLSGRFGEVIHINPFLQSIKLTQPAQLNDYENYSPQLLLWLESDPAIRQGNLATWLSHLTTLNTTVYLYLSLLRDTAQFDKIQLINGFYQRPLPPKTSCHLILLRIEKSFGIVPRMQLGHHGLSLRLCDISTMREVRETDAKFDLALCQL